MEQRDNSDSLTRSRDDPARLTGPLMVFIRLGLLMPWLILAACSGGGGGGGGGLGDIPILVPTDVVVADIDGDGRADVVTLGMIMTGLHREGRLSVYRQTASGAFSAPDVYNVGVYPWRLRVADIDGDGLADLVIGDTDGGQVLWMKQDPSRPGRFEAPIVVASGMPSVEDIAVGDLNHDGVPDIAIAECNDESKGVLVVYQDPADRGTFQQPTAIAAPGPACGVAVADIDGDGRDDLAGWFVTRDLTTDGSTITPGAGVLGVTWQLADGTMGPVTAIATRENVNVVRVVAADYLGNGAIGLIAYLTPQTEGYPQILVAQPDPGSRAFTAFTAASLQGMQGLDDAAFADLDGDGHVDAVIAGFFPVGSPSSVESRANRLRQIGDGTLLFVGADSLPISASVVAVGDLNGDGRTDIVLYGGVGGDDQVVRMLQSPVQPGQFGAPLPLR